MLEEATKAAGQAAATISSTTWGALLILSWCLFGVLWWTMRRDLKAEQDAHQETREEYVEFLKGKDHIATGMISVQDSQKALVDGQQRQTALLIEALSAMRRA